MYEPAFEGQTHGLIPPRNLTEPGSDALIASEWYVRYDRTPDTPPAFPLYQYFDSGQLLRCVCKVEWSRHSKIYNTSFCAETSLLFNSLSISESPDLAPSYLVLSLRLHRH